MKKSLLFWMFIYGSMIFLSLIPNLFYAHNQADKVLHILGYSIVMLCPVIELKRIAHIFVAAFFLFLGGCLVEVLQYLIGGREASVYDAMANGVGIIYGLVAGGLVRKGLAANLKAFPK